MDLWALVDPLVYIALSLLFSSSRLREWLPAEYRMLLGFTGHRSLDFFDIGHQFQRHVGA